MGKKSADSILYFIYNRCLFYLFVELYIDMLDHNLYPLNMIIYLTANLFHEVFQYNSLII